MGPEGIEPPTDGLEPSIMPFNYSPLIKIDRVDLKRFSNKLFCLFNLFIGN